MTYLCPLCDQDVDTPKHDCSRAPPRTPAQRVARVLKEISGVASSYGVTSNDQQFLRSLQERAPRSLSVNQEKWLKAIERKVFEDG